MSEKILVAYASRTGSTREVAEAIGQALAAGEADVDVRSAKDAGDVAAYDAVVIGSAIRAGKWLPEATKLVSANREVLAERPVAYFVVCLTMKDNTRESRKTVSAYLDPVRALVEPVSVGLFAGTLDYDRLPLPLRPIMKYGFKAPAGDFRDFGAIRAWAASLLPSLTGADSVAVGH